MNETISIGFAIPGSFCTFAKTLTLLSELVKQGYEVQPIFSNHTSHLDNRFTAAETFCKKVERITGNTGIYTIQDAEPIGPKVRQYLLQKAPQADRICILVDSLLPCRQYCFLCHVTKKRCNRHMRRHLQVL